MCEQKIKLIVFLPEISRTLETTTVGGTFVAIDAVFSLLLIATTIIMMITSAAPATLQIKRFP